MISTRRRHFTALVDRLSTLGVYVLAMTLIWTSITAHLVQERAQTLADATENARNLARGFEENIASAFTAVDQALIFMREVYSVQRADFDLAHWARSSAFLNSQTVQMSMADRHGIVLQSNLGPAAGTVSIADRRHFVFQRDSDADELFISRPVLGRVSHRMTLNVTRKLLAADGSFDGIAVVSFSPGYLNAFYNSLHLGHDSLTIAGDDGMIRAGTPDMPEVDESLPLDPQLLALSQSGDVQAGGAGDALLADGGGRIVALRRVHGFPLTVVVEIPLSEALAGYVKDQSGYLLAGGAITLLVTMIWLLLVHQRARSLRSLKKMARTLESITQGLLMVGPDRRIAVVNHRAVELLGLPPGLAKEGGSFDALCDWQEAQGEFGNPTDGNEVHKLFSNARRFQPGTSSYERLRSNGTALEVRTTMLPDGSAVRTFTDVTERRRYEEALRTAKEAAEAGIRARTAFLAMMSHEIRTPLNGIIGVAGLLADRPLAGEDAEHIRIIRQSGEHLLALLNDILDYSKLDAGRVELEAKAFNLPSLLERITRMLRPQAEQKELTLAVAVGDGVPAWVSSDSAKLSQILLNLVGNAVKFTPSGRVDLTVGRDAGSDGALLFTVEDTGIGIPAAAREKLFTEFMQVDQSISRRFGGTGLGLAICAGIVRLMDGEIGVESVPDQGSRFWFTVRMPACAPPAEAAPAMAAVSAPLRILLAEDNAVNRLIATRILARDGHTVDVAGDGVEALAAFRATRYDLVLTDVMMPEMDGLALTRHIRNLPEPACHVPIVGLTAKTSAADIEECLSAGMDGHVAKPIDAVQLAQAIAAACGRAPGGTGSAVSGEQDAVEFSAAAFDALAEAIGLDGAREAIDLFRTGAATTRETVRRLAADGDVTGLTREIHALASAALAVGLEALGRCARALEHDLTDGDCADLAIRLDVMDRLLGRGMDHLEQLMVG